MDTDREPIRFPFPVQTFLVSVRLNEKNDPGTNELFRIGTVIMLESSVESLSNQW